MDDWWTRDIFRRFLFPCIDMPIFGETSLFLLVLLLATLFQLSHGDVGTSAHYSPPYSRKCRYNVYNCNFHNWNLKPSPSFLTFFFHSRVIVMQPPPAMEVRCHSSHQATCLPPPAREYGIMAQPAGDSTWWDVSAQLFLELAFRTRWFRLGLWIVRKRQGQVLHRMEPP